MKLIKWNFDKAKKLKEERGIELEQIAVLIAENRYFGIMDIPHRDQKMFVLDYNDYVVCVPFIESNSEIFIKTAFKSRKINKQLKEK